MARTVKEIQKQIYESIQADPILGVKLTSPSKFAVWRLFTFVIAAIIAIFEQILDANTSNLEDIARNTPISTPQWWTKKAKEFQYSIDDPQVLSLINNVPQYSVIDESLQIVTASSIVSPDFKRNVIKIAKGDITDLQPLDSQELNALKSYFREVSPSGLVPNVLSETSDLIYIDCDIYYNGEFLESDVKQDCIDSILSYLQGLDFNGNVFINGIIDSIQSVDGVSDIVLKNVDLRDYTESFGDGTELVNNNTIITRFANATAGYIKEETSAGNTFNDTFNMTL